MLDQRDTRAERREATIERILDAAWTLARRDGLTAFTLRDVAAAVGMRAPSLYSYFDSKFALYDAMFAQGNRELLEEMPSLDGPDFEKALRRAATFWLAWATRDPVRNQLLFQRTIPGFAPSPASYASAVEVFTSSQAAFAAAGITDLKHFELWTAILSGLANQQLANEPGGKRYVRLVGEAVDMFLNHIGYRKGRKR